MLLADAEKLALELMAQFGLLPNWYFKFDNAKGRFGGCHRSRTLRYIGGLGFSEISNSLRQIAQGGKITLSREMVLLNDRKQVEDCIRHEIAHALCPAKTRHGAEWKAMCIKTGANPERLCGEDVVRIEGDWSATCGVCGKVYYKFKRPRGEYYCPDKECKHKPLPYIPRMVGSLHPMRKLTFRHKDALPESKPPRAAIEAMKALLREQEKK
jgi:hypothetical protein